MCRLVCVPWIRLDELPCGSLHLMTPLNRRWSLLRVDVSACWMLLLDATPFQQSGRNNSKGPNDALYFSLSSGDFLLAKGPWRIHIWVIYLFYFFGTLSGKTLKKVYYSKLCLINVFILSECGVHCVLEALLFLWWSSYYQSPLRN